MTKTLLATAVLLAFSLLAACQPTLKTARPQSHDDPNRDFYERLNLAERAPALDLRAVMPPGLRITWMGFSGFHIETPSGKIILIDPWIEHSPSAPAAFKHVARADLILVTHAHRDHLGDAVTIAKETGAKVVAIYDLVHWLERRGVTSFVRLNKGGSYLFDGICVTMVHASHSNVSCRETRSSTPERRPATWSS
jgi:L-ascorbate metabolism protein UlaG (beta-lactamase superfamily)